MQGKNPKGLVKCIIKHRNETMKSFEVVAFVVNKKSYAHLFQKEWMGFLFSTYFLFGIMLK